MNAVAPTFATGIRVAGAVLVAGYVSGLVPGAVVSLVGGLALITFGRTLLLDRQGTAVSGAALAIAAGALGVAALRWGTLSLSEIVGVQSVLGPSVAVGPTEAAVSSGVALAATLLALAAWSIEPVTETRAARLWSLVEGILAVLAAVIVFAAPGVGGALSELFGDPVEIGVTAGVTVAGIVAIVLAPRLFASRRVRWVLIGASALAALAAAGIVAGSL